MAAETKIKIKGIPPYDGEYELDLETAFTAREWRWLKQIGSIYPKNFEQALGDADIDVFISLAVISMVRAGKVDRDDVLDVADRLSDAPFDGAAIELIHLGSDEEDDAIPPVSTLERVEQSPRSSLSSVTATKSSDGTSGSGSPIGSAA